MQVHQNALPRPLKSRLLNREYPIYPTLGIAGVFCGTLFAIFLIPAEVSAKESLFPSAVMMTIGLAIAPLAAAIKNPKTILRAEHILVLAPIYWLLLDLLQNAYVIEQAWLAGIKGAFFGIGLFVTGVWLASMVSSLSLPKPVINSSSHKLRSKTLFGLILIFFTLGIFKYAFPCNFNPVTMVSYLLVDRWSAPWSRASMGGWSSFLDHMSYFGYLLPTLTVLLGIRSKRFNFQVATSSFLSIFMAVFLAQSGSRRVIGVIFGAAIICWLIEQRKLKLKELLIAFISMALLLTVMQNMLNFRGSGFAAAFDETEETEAIYQHIHVDDNFYRLSQTVSIVPRFSPYVYEKQIVFALIRPIPRAIWKSKPTDPGFDLATTIGKTGVALTHSVIGDWYITGGWIAVFIGGLLYGALAKSITTLLIKDADSAGGLVYSLMVMAMFAGVRAMIDIVLMSYALFAWMAISWILLPKVRRVSSN